MTPLLHLAAIVGAVATCLLALFGGIIVVRRYADERQRHDDAAADALAEKGARLTATLQAQKYDFDKAVRGVRQQRRRESARVRLEAGARVRGRSNVTPITSVRRLG